MPTLAQLGGCLFEVAPMNFHEVSNDTGADFVAHPVVGAAPPLEFVGETNETWTIRGRLFPEKFGGLSNMSALQAMRASGSSHFFMRGDGVPIGWVVIDKVTQRSTYIGSHGVGRVIEFDVSLKRDTPPGADGIFNALIGLFANG